MIWGIGIACALWLVYALMRDRRPVTLSSDFRTLTAHNDTFRVDWAIGIIRELTQSMETYRPVAGEAPAGMRPPEPVNRSEQRDLGVRYHNVSESFTLEHPGGRLPFTLKESQGAASHYYFYEAEGKRLNVIWITGKKQTTGKLLSLAIESEKYDHRIDHPALKEARRQVDVTSPMGLLPALVLGWIMGAQVISTGFLAGLLGAGAVVIVYFIVSSVFAGRSRDRVDGLLSDLREFIGRTPKAPLDPSTAPAESTGG